MKKLTKQMIEELGNKVVEICKTKGYNDTSVYFNGKCVHVGSGDLVWDDDTDNFYYKNVPIVIKENDHPGDHFEYYNDNHILSMSFEGLLYDLLNYGNGSHTLDNLFDEYGLYYELGNAWNLSVYPNDDDMIVDGYSYKRKQEPIHLWYSKENVPTFLRHIMDWWYTESEKEGDEGSCVSGAGFNFELDNIPYFMSACSPWQGNISWERNVDRVEEMLKEIGATNIWFDYGHID